MAKKESTIMQAAVEISTAIYKIADAIQSEFPDEQWRTVTKLKNGAIDAYFYVAQVEGAGTRQSLEFDCISARKMLHGIKAMYVFADRQHFTELDPELMVKIDALIDRIDEARELSLAEMKRRTNEELEPWVEKYRIWQEISKK